MVNLCAPCRATQVADEQVKSGGVDQLWVREQALRELATSGRDTVELHTVSKQWEPRRVLRGGRFVDDVSLHGHGWLIGTIKWAHNNGGNYGGTDVITNWLTALVEHPMSGTYNSGPLVRVAKDPDRPGYIVQTEHGTVKDHWTKVATTIRNMVTQSG
jgi:hypothetical protein